MTRNRRRRQPTTERRQRVTVDTVRTAPPRVVSEDHPPESRPRRSRRTSIPAPTTWRSSCAAWHRSSRCSSGDRPAHQTSGPRAAGRDRGAAMTDEPTDRRARSSASTRSRTALIRRWVARSSRTPTSGCDTAPRSPKHRQGGECVTLDRVPATTGVRRGIRRHRRRRSRTGDPAQARPHKLKRSAPLPKGAPVHERRPPCR